MKTQKYWIIYNPFRQLSLSLSLFFNNTQLYMWLKSILQVVLVLFMVHLVKSATASGSLSSPVQSPRSSSLYWGVEYKSRHTGPFSVATKSKDVPFGVGSACRQPQWITNNMWKWGTEHRKAVCPTKANRKLPLTIEKNQHWQIVLFKQICFPVGPVTVAAPLSQALEGSALGFLFTLHHTGWTW